MNSRQEKCLGPGGQSGPLFSLIAWCLSFPVFGFTISSTCGEKPKEGNQEIKPCDENCGPDVGPAEDMGGNDIKNQRSFPTNLRGFFTRLRSFSFPFFSCFPFLTDEVKRKAK
jgi:hypothetical protein